MNNEINDQSNGSIGWNDSLMIGIPEVDEQHKILLGLFHQLTSLSDGEDNRDKILELLNELKDYSNYHFKTEEEIMQRDNLPYLELQMEQHELFKQKISKFIIDQNYNNMVLLNQITLFLRKWLIVHISNVDARTLKH